MKMTMEVDCTPEEARRFLGLPDVTEANQAYVEAVTKAIRGEASLEQIQAYAKQLAPVGQAGVKLFQQIMESGAGAAMSALKKKPDKST
jgi:hypothetical protein